MSFAVATLLAMAAGVQSPTVVMPQGLPGGVREASVVCRDARGGWAIAREWHQVTGASFTVPVAATRCRVLLRLSGATVYLASAELRMRTTGSSIVMEPRWLRSIDVPAGVGLTWLGVAEGEFVECVRSGDGARCWFVPVTSAGIIVSQVEPRFQFIAVPSGDWGGGAPWQQADWGRLVRARSPAGQVSAAVVALRDALKQGAGSLKEVRPAAGISLLRLGPETFWLHGAMTPDMLLELRGVGAATTRVPLAAAVSAGPAILDVVLQHQEVITGEVRNAGSSVQGATVLLSRLLDVQGVPVRDEERPRERAGEAVTGPTGEFRFDGLGVGKYEIHALHPSLGRARVVVTATSHARLQLQPRAVVRGKVLRHGIPVAGAVVQVLPSIDAVTTARDPATLSSGAVRSDALGRFEAIAPDEGRVTLSVTADSGAVRIDIGDAAALPNVTDVGEIKLEEPLAVEVLVELPNGCELRAAGPMGTSGLTTVTALPSGRGRWGLTLPHPGRWLVAGICPGREIALEPALITVPLARTEPIVLTVRR